jgi:hypothetical protein
LYFHHTWHHWKEQSLKPFLQIKDHVLLMQAATGIEQADETLKKLLTPEKINAIVSLIPDTWLHDHEQEDANAMRTVYSEFLNNRISHSDIFVNQIKDAGKSFI